MAVTALLLFVAGYAYLALLGAAVAPVLLPRRWLPLAPVAAPFLGWSVLVALGYPLNTLLPFRAVALLLGVGAALACLLALRQRRLRLPVRCWREALPPALAGLCVYAVATALHARQGAVTALVVDSDVEHFADVISALLHYPIGADVAGQQGLEATPVGLAYYAVHATLGAVTGWDAFTTALPAHFLMLALAASGTYLFARSFVGLPPGAALLATVLYACGALPLVVAAFGWGQQTAALATVPPALAALRVGLSARDGRSLLAAGLLGSLAAGSLYLATAPLVGAAAGALALLQAVRRRSPFPLGRLVAVGAIVAGAGLFSHLSAGAFLLERVAAGLLRPDELSGRSTHVFDFAAPAGLAGVAPLDLFRDVTTLDGAPRLTWPTAGDAVGAVAAFGALALILAGTLSRRPTRPALAALLAVVLLYWGYLRWGRPFPYGEFKLLSTVWFLAPVLAVAGWQTLSARRRWASIASLSLATYALGLGLTWGHTARFLSLPWGATLPEGAMADARRVVGALPAGTSVLVSGGLVPIVALESAPLLTPHRAGFPSAPARAGYLTKRWRGAVTSLIAFSGHPVYGLVQRHSTELRAPALPSDADFLLLDALEDPRLYGVTEPDLVASAGTLRLYRQAGRPTLVLADLAASGTVRLRAGERSLTATETATDVAASAAASPGTAPRMTASRMGAPAPVLPIGESLPGRRQGLAPRATAAPPRTVEPTEREVTSRPPGGARGQLLLGFHAVGVAPVRVLVRGPGSAGPILAARDLVLTPGLTWYTTPAVDLPAEVEVTLPDGGESVRLTGATLLQSRPGGGALRGTPDGGALQGRREGGAAGEALERSPAGTVWPLLTLGAAVSGADGSLSLEAWYTYLGPREGEAQVRLRDATELWIGGQSTPIGLHLGPGGRTWRATLAPGARPRQALSDGRTVPDAGVWDRAPGRRWLWLEIGPERGVALHEPPLVALEIGSGSGAGSSGSGEAGARVRIVAGAPGGVVLPLLAEPAPLPPVPEGTLVKGSADALFYVEGGTLRWVPEAAVLERRRIPWRLSVLEDHALWRLPVGLPLT